MGRDWEWLQKSRTLSRDTKLGRAGGVKADCGETSGAGVETVGSGGS